MAVSPAEAIKAAKLEQAERIIAAINEARKAIQSEPDLWFGGLPPVFVQVDVDLDYKIRQIRDALGIEDPALAAARAEREALERAAS